MNQKNLIIIAVAAIVAIGAYLMFGGGYLNPPGTSVVPQTAPK